jgi:short-subunit dehydrogenase
LKYPKIDVLINNAGIIIPKTHENLSYEDHLRTLQVNYLAPVHLTTSLLTNLNGGHVVTIASVASIFQGQ